ncbi:MAG: hypothetical protein SFU98_08395 [Leptospiraceae bacterium]|nr:hypothetical protein [Leptospiraceae bacterium]
MSISLLFFIASYCGRREEPEIKNQIISYLISQSLTSTGSPCQNFSLSEAACIVAPELSSTTCSSSEISRLKLIIEPTSLRTDEVLDKFFVCWKNCNLIFNVQETICMKDKFATNKAYREAQRSGTTSSSTNWGICMNRCNKGEDTESGLNKTGASYPKSAY